MIKIASLAYTLLPLIIVDRVLAIVAGHPITLSEVELEARILLAMRGGLEAMNVHLDQDFLCSTLETVINEYIISAEADRLKIEPVGNHELQEALKNFRSRFNTQMEFEEFLKNLELTPTELAGIQARHIRVERLMASRIRSRVLVLPEEVRDFFNAYPSRFKNLQEARNHLVLSKQTNLLKQWLVDIRQRYKVEQILLSGRKEARFPACYQQ